ncbi:MAG: hypothetical protein KC483_08740 [Nitrosarchaeum sp.]|nr:hypothetical protein [Nitrosarchaeum sp.]
MQEIAILLSSLAGVATAAAVRKIPRNKTQLLSLGASSHIKSQIRTLNIEKDILTKTISRLYQADSEFSKIQRDKLLVKYQHQLGIILARLEKLEQASQHPDLGPVGDGLITLMDQKLSKLDDRLYELSSKIATVDVSVPEIKSDKPKNDEKVETKENKISFGFEKSKHTQEPIIIPPRKRQSFELTTLTKLSRSEPKFPSFETQNVREIIQEKPIGNNAKQGIETEQIQIKPISQEIVKPEIVIEPEVKLDTKPDIIKEVAKITKHKALPSPDKPRPVVLDEDFDDDSDSDDLDKIKGEIMSVLSKLDQAEVE